MAQKSEKKCKAPRLSKNKNKKKRLLSRAEWLYILVEGKETWGPSNGVT